jgi:hypothetical protein
MAPGPLRYAPHYRSSWALAIGINAYQQMPPLACASKDAQDIAECLINRFDFPRHQVILLQDELATHENILAAFDTIINRWNIAPDDRLMIFFAGHGLIRETSDGSKVGYLAPVDAQPQAWRTLIRMSDLIDQASFLAAKHILFIMDSCYSGLSFMRQAQADPIVEHFLTRRAIQMMTSGKGTEPVADGGDRENDNSIFTGHLLEALSGDAATASGLMTASDVMHYVYRHVTRTPKINQTPQYGWLSGDGDFVLQFPHGKGLPLSIEVSLRQGTAPSRLMAVNELVDMASDTTSSYAQLAMERLEEVARHDPDPNVRYTALRILGVETKQPSMPPKPVIFQAGHRLKLWNKAGHNLRLTWPLALAAWATVCLLIITSATVVTWRVKALEEVTEGQRTAGPLLTGSPPPPDLVLGATTTRPHSTLIPGAVLPSALAADHSILFQDDFTHSDERWEPAPNNQRAARTVSGDGQMVFALYDDYTLWVAQPRQLAMRDAIISVETTILTEADDGAYGLVFRQLDFDNYYYLRIGMDGTYTLTVESGGAVQQLVQPTALPRKPTKGEPHRITAHASGSQIGLYFDGESIASVHSRKLSYLRGSIGVVVETRVDAPLEVAFDNFVAVEP